ncbi:heme-binding protein [Methylobacillus gramineus]|uniref:GlcG/HbpS family heme-binding protein n=1 Tax=Methylobacillus gramineus TaxID=755169 RepID=UPI001CFF9AEB|nr:heme-binding protein [Methylobacillus gramineus]MCB5185325.1 heme-binding protein [Methylobacillus gramineus]
MNIKLFAAGLALIGSTLSIQAMAFESQPVMNLDTAQKIAAGCQDEASKHGWKMSVSIVDGGANPIYFHRADGAYIGSGEIANMKAQNSAKMQMPTSLLDEFAFGKDKKGGPAPGIAHIPGFITLAGGLPIKTSKAFLGAVGVSGGMPHEDEACAQAGLEAVKSLLK